jgi:TonB family protein
MNRSSIATYAIFLLAAIFFLVSCTATEKALADKKNYTGDNTEYRRNFEVTFDENEKPLRYGYYYIVSTVPEGYKVRVFHPEKKILTEEKLYSTPALTLLHGYYKSWWDDGSIREEGTYEFGRKHGVWLEKEPAKGKSASGEYFNHRKEGLWTQLDTSGMVESVYNWKDDKRHGKFQLFDSAGTQTNEGIYRNDTLIGSLFPIDVTTKPYLRDCEEAGVLDVFQCTDNVLKQYVYSELRYPASAREHKIQGQAFAQWDIEADGSVSNIRVPQALSDDIEKAVINVLEKLPSWRPATKKGVAVKSTVSMPLTFSVN